MRRLAASLPGAVTSFTAHMPTRAMMACGNEMLYDARVGMAPNDYAARGRVYQLNSSPSEHAGKHLVAAHGDRLRLESCRAGLGPVRVPRL